MSYSTYLPTSYLVKVYSEVKVGKVGLAAVYGPVPGTKLYLLLQKLCLKAPDVISDPPLPLTSKKPLTSSQLQRLANLRRAASLRSAGRSTWLQWQPGAGFAYIAKGLLGVYEFSTLPSSSWDYGVLSYLNPGIFSPGYILLQPLTYPTSNTQSPAFACSYLQRGLTLWLLQDIRTSAESVERGNVGPDPLPVHCPPMPHAQFQATVSQSLAWDPNNCLGST